MILLDLLSSQHFTRPPARFSYASSVKFLEERGIGRPSTYVPIIQTLLLRNYVHREKAYFIPTELGIKLYDLLIEYFKKIMDLDFTALMEEELDEVEEGRIEWLKVLRGFYPTFKERLDFATTHAKKHVEETDKLRPQCNRHMVM